MMSTDGNNGHTGRRKPCLIAAIVFGLIAGIAYTVFIAVGFASLHDRTAAVPMVVNVEGTTFVISALAADVMGWFMFFTSRLRRFSLRHAFLLAGNAFMVSAIAVSFILDAHTAWIGWSLAGISFAMFVAYCVKSTIDERRGHKTIAG